MVGNVRELVIQPQEVYIGPCSSHKEQIVSTQKRHYFTIGFMFIIIIIATMTFLKRRNNDVIREDEMRLLFMYIADHDCDCMSLTIDSINVHI